MFHFYRGFYTICAILKAMEVNIDSRVMEFMIQDLRQSPEKDAMYTAAVELAEEIMKGIGRLERSGTVETATLFITQTGAQLNILTCSFDDIPLDRMFASSLQRSSYDADIGYIQTYVIPILAPDASDSDQEN
ncbi:MAG: hypothetical protein MUP60_03700 [Candidatus Thorarchaeota archaeon]|nr:hypothetical protein [Candidatus Thorarchaeota archaeon]